MDLYEERYSQDQECRHSTEKNNLKLTEFYSESFSNRSKTIYRHVNK